MRTVRFGLRGEGGVYCLSREDEEIILRPEANI